MLALTGWSSLPALPLMRQPVLVLNGDDDRAIPVTNSRILARLIPDARLVVIPGGEHLMLFDRTAETAAAVADFLMAPDNDCSAAYSRRTRRRRRR
jgi:pimeloyl-ACP methyl ester carboxylesterase